MSGASWESVVGDRQGVKLRFREWDGVGRPDYTTITVPPGVARVRAAELIAAADECEAHQLEIARERHAALIKQRDELQIQLEALDCDIVKMTVKMEEPHG